MCASSAKSKEYEPSWRLRPYQSIVSVRQDIKSGCIGFPFIRRNHNPVIKPLQTFRIRDREV